jgi:hypothetical protein
MHAVCACIVQLFMQMSSCSVLGAGLRVGATIAIHNAHLIYLHGKLEGFGACMRTHCQVIVTPLYYTGTSMYTRQHL